MEDVYSALGLIPHFRWRWERKGRKRRCAPDDDRPSEEGVPVVGRGAASGDIPYLMPEEDWNNENHSRLGQKLSPPQLGQEVPGAFTFENVPPGLFFPGPAWPEPPDGWGSDEGTAPTSPTTGTPCTRRTST
jgi:hypothetical protein